MTRPYITEADVWAYYQRKGIVAGEQADEPDYCFHCLDVLDGPRDECPCLPVEPPCEEYDVRRDR